MIDKHVRELNKQNINLKQQNNINYTNCTIQSSETFYLNHLPSTSQHIHEPPYFHPKSLIQICTLSETSSRTKKLYLAFY